MAQQYGSDVMKLWISATDYIEIKNPPSILKNKIAIIVNIARFHAFMKTCQATPNLPMSKGSIMIVIEQCIERALDVFSALELVAATSVMVAYRKY